ncbi:tetratricopeptide repeat protein [Verrucomicrobiaceae bacterium 227]
MSLHPSPTFRNLIAALLGVVLTSTGFGQSESEQRQFTEAERYYEAGKAQNDQYEKGRYMTYVIGLYVKHLNTYPNSPNAPAAWFHLGHAQQTLGKIEECRKSYQTLIQRFRRGPYVGSAARQMAYLAYVEEDWADAAKYFEITAEHLTQDSLRYNALTKQVQCLLKLNRTEEVKDALKKIIDSKNHPYRDWARFMLGYQYYEADKFQTAINVFEPLLAEETTSNYRSQALFYTGLSSAELGRDDVAESHLISVLEMPPNHPSLTAEQRSHLSTNKGKAQTALMGLYSKKKDYQRVIDFYKMGDFGMAGRVEARRSMRGGNAFFNLGDYQQARAAYRRVDRALPNSRTAFISSFQCLLCDYQLQHPGLPQRVDIFLEIYGKMRGFEKEIDMALFLKAENLYLDGAFDQAAVILENVDPQNLSLEFRPEMLFKRGWSLSESGNFDRATASFGRFLSEFPEDPRRPSVLAKRAEAYSALGNRTAALRDFEELIQLEPEPELMSFALQGSARCLREEKKYESMITRFRRLIADFPDLPKLTVANANYWIGWGFYKQEKHDDVARYIRKARDLAPEYYSQPAGNILILSAFAQRDKAALHVALQEVFSVAPEKFIPPLLLSWLGVQMFHDGQTEIAADYLERATDPARPKRTEVGVWRTLAKAQNKTGRFQKALTTVKLLLPLDQKPIWIADAHLDLAEAQLGLGQYEDALASAKKGLEMNIPGPHLAGLHLVEGEVALQQKRMEDALAQFRTAISMVPDDPYLQPRALAGASIAARALGDEETATNYQNTLQSSFPNWKPVISISEETE